MYFRRLMFFLLLLGIGPPLFAQATANGTITGSGCVSIGVTGQSTVAMTVAYTASGSNWTGTIQPEVAMQGQAAADVQVTPSTSSTAQSTITANGIYVANVAGYDLFLLCGATVTHTAAIFLNSTKQISSLAGSGSGGSGVSSFTGDSSGVISNSASTGAVTVTFTNTPTGTGSLVLANTPTLVTPVLGAATGTSLTLGTDNSVAGTLQLANGSAAAHTIFASGATTTNTIKGFATVPTTGHLVTCTVSSTTCTLTDGGAVPSGGVSSVTGTANQIDVATGTTTPVLSLDPAIILPGTIQIPTQVVTTPGIKFGSSTAGIGNHTGNSLDLAGSSTNFYTAGGTTLGVEIVPSITASFISAVPANNQLGVDATLTTSTTAAGIELSATGGGPLTATSGTQIGVNVSGDGNGADSFAPTSGSANFIDLLVQPKINQTGGANGTVTILGAYPLNTAVGGTEYLLGLGTASAQSQSATLTNKFTVDNSGNVVAAGGITATLTNSDTGDYVCYNAGVFEFDATACLASLGKFKQNISPLSSKSSLAEVAHLTPVQFQWKPDFRSTRNLQLGLIAEQVEKVDPRLAAYKDNGELESVDYNHVIALDTAAIQELQKEVVELRREIRKLKTSAR